MKKIYVFFILFNLLFIPFFISAQSPPPVESSISISITIPEPSVTPPGGGGGGGITPLPGPAKVTFEGKAYPGAFVTLLKNEKIAGTAIAESSGDFRIVLTGVTSGTWTFGVFAEDAEKRKSVTMSFTTNILGGMDTTISNIFISPTIALSGSAYKKGETLKAEGYSYPEGELNIVISSPEIFVEKAEVGSNGKWNYAFDTKVLEIGNHSAKALARTSGGLQSPYSEVMTFKVMDACQGADLSFDGKVNLVDFSILLYFWNNSNPSNICADISSDRNVNLTDFSIMMYWWNG